MVEDFDRDEDEVRRLGEGEDLRCQGEEDDSWEERHAMHAMVLTGASSTEAAGRATEGPWWQLTAYCKLQIAVRALVRQTVGQGLTQSPCCCQAGTCACAICSRCVAFAHALAHKTFLLGFDCHTKACDGCPVMPQSPRPWLDPGRAIARGETV